MSQTFRLPDILEIARAEGKVTVENLAERFDVTVQTIRRDLAELANAGKLERVHGGAILPSGVSNILYEERRRLNEPGKLAIARACAAAIPDDASLFLDIGTTTEAVARELMDHRNLMVVTNNINVAQILMSNSDSEIIVAGGAATGLKGNRHIRYEEGTSLANLHLTLLDRVGVPVGTVMSRLHRGRKLLASQMQEPLLAA
jgi:DeoR family glycerol-3-phosphate regulon repressor